MKPTLENIEANLDKPLLQCNDCGDLSRTADDAWEHYQESPCNHNYNMVRFASDDLRVERELAVEYEMMTDRTYRTKAVGTPNYGEVTYDEADPDQEDDYRDTQWRD
jgi:hypothetical protein